MTEVSSKSTRIAKNTLFLYIRMLIILSIRLYTSRVVLQVLGISEYGVYTVVGGVVVMFSFLTTALSTAVSRYQTYSLGHDNIKVQQQVFSTCLSIILIISLILIILIELIAPWFLNTKLDIPDGLMNAAQWCLQFSIIAFFFNLFSIPYNASIIAHEKMNAYAYISVFEAILQLLIVSCLIFLKGNKLIWYGAMMAILAIVIRLIYGLYCRKNFQECKYSFSIDKALAKDIFGFTSWSILGNGAFILNTQGINIIMNMFFGVTINAARGIADQVQGAIMQLLLSFTTALNPQIVKSYASGDERYVNKLVCSGAKFSFFLSLLFAIPLELETEFILKLWLGNYPSYAPIFVRLAIIATMIDFLGNTIARAVWATGKVKSYYLLTSCISVLVLPISYIFYKKGFNPQFSYIVFILIYAILIPVRLRILKELMNFSPKQFVAYTIMPLIPVTLLSIIIPVVIRILMTPSVFRLIIVAIVSISSTTFFAYFIGLTSEERSLLKNKFRHLLKNTHI